VLCWFHSVGYRKLGEYLGISHQAVGRKINTWTEKGISYHDIKDLPLSDATKILFTGRPPRQSRFTLANYEEKAKQIVATKGRKGVLNIRFHFKAYVKEVGEANAVAESTYYAGIKAALKNPKFALTIIENPGERLYVDYAGLRLPIGPKKDKNYAYFIIGVLGYSKKLFIRASTHRKQKDWLDFMQWIFIRIGGIVKFVITDNAIPLVTTPKPNLKLTKVISNFTSIMMLSPIRHVDAKKLTVTVPKGKGSYDRTVPIAQRTIDALNDYLENVIPELATFKSGDALFLGMTGKRILSSKLTELV